MVTCFRQRTRSSIVRYLARHDVCVSAMGPLHGCSSYYTMALLENSCIFQRHIPLTVTFCKQTGSVVTSKNPWLHHLRFITLPRIRVKPDPALDEITERDKILRPFYRIFDMVTHQKSLAIKVRHLHKKRWDLGIKNRKLTVVGFMKRYPNIFICYTSPSDGKPLCKLTEEAMTIVEEEVNIRQDQGSRNVQTLQRLLMMAVGCRIRVDKLKSVWRVFGFPEKFMDSVVRANPHLFKVVHDEEMHAYIELVEWDESLAVSELEKRAKQDAMEKGLGDIEVRGKPFHFKYKLSPGMALRKKNLEFLAQWQEIPYISPYEDWTLVKRGSPLSEKRLAALLHEFLSLTIEKKARLKVIQPFRDEFGLSQKVHHLFDRFPGIFYTSLRGGIKTIMLREAYKESDVIEGHPLIQLKEKLLQLVHAGPRLRGPKVKAEESGPSEEGQGIDAQSGDESLVGEVEDGEDLDSSEDEESDSDDESNEENAV